MTWRPPDREDRQDVKEGLNIRLKFAAEDITNSVSKADKQAVQSVASGYSVCEYVDIELLKQIEGYEWENIHETKKAVRITLRIPEKLLGVSGRTFAIVRVHRDKAQFLNDLDGDPDTITFATDEFSTYAILYRDPGTEPPDNSNPPDHENPPDNPNGGPGDQNPPDNQNQPGNQNAPGSTNPSDNPYQSLYPDVSKTGDESDIGLWLLIMILSFIGMFAFRTRMKAEKPLAGEGKGTGKDGTGKED